MRAGVSCALVKTEPVEKRIRVGAELDTELDRARVARIPYRRRGERRIPQAARTGDGDAGDRNAGAACLDVAAVIGGARLQRNRTRAENGPGIRPILATCRAFPR